MPKKHVCAICKKPIKLVPSIQERCKKYDQTPDYYRSIFTTHDSCFLEKRKAELSDLIIRLNSIVA